MHLTNLEMNAQHGKGKEEIVNRKGKKRSPARISAGAESKHMIFHSDRIYSKVEYDYENRKRQSEAAKYISISIKRQAV